MNYAILLAAGKGSRMKSDVPKCVISLLGKPMILYLAEELKKIDIDKIVCVVGDNRKEIERVLQKEVEYVIQPQPLGSGNAVECCRGIEQSGYTIILNGDTPFIDHTMLDSLIDFHLKNKNRLTLGSFICDTPTGYGRIIRDRNNKLVEIIEEIHLNSEQKKIKEVNGGLYCVNTDILFQALSKLKKDPLKKEYFLTDIVRILKDEPIDCLCFDRTMRLMGINNPLELAMMEEYLRKSILEKHLKNGVRIMGLKDTWIGPDVYIEAGASIFGSKIFGKSIIHKNTEIIDSEITDSEILEKSIVKKSVVTESIIGKNCMVGPFSHIRSNTYLAGDNRIGNYVEIKNSTIGTKTKLSHLAYMGDTLCGEAVNFGCGSITVNYDGKRKNNTTIGDNAFIGCNTNLIAPIHIESNSFIAAGSTITHNLEEGDFAIARSLQITKKGYATKYEKE